MIVVVGYIPTPEGQAALKAALAECTRRQARLVLVNASRGDAPVDPRFSDIEDWAATRERIAASGVDHVEIQSIESADPADQVLDTAREQGADLIVIGLRKRTPVGKLILGSVAQRILLEAECPVLAVKSGTDHGRHFWGGHRA